MKDECLLSRLAERGSVRISNGQLEILPHSVKEVPAEWLKKNQERIIFEILKLLSLDAYQYLSYKTGHFGKAHIYDGVHLSFINIRNAEQSYAVFNAELYRERNTKHGEAGQTLPKGQFRVTKKCMFYRFWLNTGLSIPSRLGLFHDYMGKLKGIVFTFDVNEKNKANNKTIMPLNVTYEAIIKALPNNIQTSSKQQTNKIQTILPNKETSQARTLQGLEQVLSTSPHNHVKSNQERANIRDGITPITIDKKPEEQSVDEWLQCYDNAKPLRLDRY
jgi:hypothetical protein